MISEIFKERLINEIVRKTISKILTEHDNYFTQYSDIGSELSHYDKEDFYNKVVMLCCDNPKVSNFWKYFSDNFEDLNLAMLVSTFWSEDENVPPKMTILTKNGLTSKRLKNNGDFLSDEIRNIMGYVDIVVTNPPFSNGYFSRFLQQLKQLGKKFIVIGPTKSGYDGKIFNMMKNDEVTTGYNKNMYFYDQMNGGKKKRVQSIWYTNMKKPQKGDFRRNNANISSLQRYDNFDAINVNFIKDIPTNYNGMIGVPPSVIEDMDYNIYQVVASKQNLRINGEKVPKRIIIQRRKR